MLAAVAPVLSGVLGSFFTFAGVSKTTPLTSMSAEMQQGFRGGAWSAIWGLPGLPFLYAVGVTEIITGLGLLGWVAGMTPQPYAQWCALIPALITLGATTSHIIKGDGNWPFCLVMFSLFSINSFAMAASRNAEVKAL